MRATVILPVVTNFVYKADSTNQSGIYPETVPVETGPILDAVPVVLADGYTISMKAIPSRIDFLGYADTSKLPPRFVTNSMGEKVELPIAQPVFRVNETSTQINIWDGQTAVLFPKPGVMPPATLDKKIAKLVADHIRQAETKEENKTLVVFVTATLIDPAGNRIHSDDEMPFAKDGIPPQPQTIPDVNFPIPQSGVTPMSPRGLP
jgi:hypothetical protein